MSIFPAGGVLSIGAFGQPNTPPTAPCIKWYGCGVGLDVDALNSTNLEILNVLDLEGIVWDCGSNTNLHDAIEQIACRKACEEITARHFSQVINGTGSGGSITLPAGGSWEVDGQLWAASDGINLINTANFTGAEIDDGRDNYLAYICGNYPGGTTFNVSEINPAVTDPVAGYAMKITATRVGDC